MRASTILTVLPFLAATWAQGVDEGIAPDASPPEGCETDVQGNFTINIRNSFSAKHRRETAQEAADGALVCNLSGGILHDQYKRTGSIVANQQFQFDGPPQAGAIYTGGFSVCKNGSLAIGGSARWWRCMSGGFGNLYDEWLGDQCTEVRIVAKMVDQPSSTSSSVAASSTTAGSSSSSGDQSSTASASATGSANSTASATAASSGSSTAGTSDKTPTATNAGQNQNNAPPASSGAAVPTRIPGAETLGAVVGIMGAALFL